MIDIERKDEYFNGEGKMVEQRDHIINVTTEHIYLFNLVRDFCIKKENPSLDYILILEDILSAAYKITRGNVDEDTLRTMLEEIIDEYFTTLLKQEILDLIVKNITIILDYYIRSIFDLDISNDRVLYLIKVNKIGVYIKEYTIEYYKR